MIATGPQTTAQEAISLKQKTYVINMKSNVSLVSKAILYQTRQKKIIEIILSNPEVTSPHHLRTRHIGNHIAIEVHIRMNGEMTLNNAHEVTKKIETALKEEFGKDTHIGIHMEPIKQGKVGVIFIYKKRGQPILVILL